METKILIQSDPKTNAANPPMTMIEIGPLASEIFLYEIVDGRIAMKEPRYTISLPFEPLSRGHQENMSVTCICP